MSLTPLQQNELERLRQLVTARSDANGHPKVGFGANVKYLRRLIADLEVLRDSADSVDG